MKYKKSFKILILIVLLLISISIASSNLNNEVDYKLNKNSPQSIRNYNKLRYSSTWSLKNIHINNNWSETADEYDWCNYKNGYYIIENVTITGGAYEKMGIFIENTNDNFTIRNCYVEDGVSLMKINNGLFINNTIYFGKINPSGLICQSGFYMGGCNNTHIKSNIINDTYNERQTLIYGIVMGYCNNITVEKNILSTYNLSQPNYFSSTGISCQSVTDRNIKLINNTIYNNGRGIDLFGEFHKIINNSIYNSRRGINLYSDCTLISNNTIKNSAESGIQIIVSYNNSIINNRLDETKVGIKGEQLSNSTIFNNTILKENEFGFYLEESNYNTISYNSIQESKKYGIYLESSNHSLITGNHITNVKDCIKEINCTDNLFENNICQKTPNPIFGYFTWVILGIIFITTMFFLKMINKKQIREI